MTDLVIDRAIDRRTLADRLIEARRRTLELVEPLDDEQLNTVYSPLLSPLGWDLGHIANFEELWLVERIGGLPALDGSLGRLYDAIENPRLARNELPILRGDELRFYMAAVRERTLTVLEWVDFEAPAKQPLLERAFVYELLIAHEHQHGETILQLLQLVDGYEPIERNRAARAEPVAPGPDWVLVEVGEEAAIGAPADQFGYDNERPRHPVSLPGFEIQRRPVTNGEFAAFVAESGCEPPLYWLCDGAGGWAREVFGRPEPLDPAHPVVHIDYSQATAYAGSIGARLPSETEWELAARGVDRDRANLDQLGFGTAPAGAYADAASDCGAVQMLGDVWEWTRSDFCPYPGFRAFPYREYSEVFFGDTYKVLRGGSWATRRNLARSSFRNWDLPERRQIFAGVRCARDLDPNRAATCS